MKRFLLLLFYVCPLVAFSQNEKEILYVGTYSVRESKGIYVFELNRAKGTLKLLQTISDLESPSFLEIHPTGQYLYSVNGGSIENNENGGSVSAFSINKKTGKLTFINHVSSHGKGPCHIALDKSGELAFISNYSEGNLIVLPVLKDGSVGAPTDAKKYSGQSVNTSRQNQPHIHSAQVSADNKFVYVSDLGTDKIYTYAIDLKNGRIKSASSSETTVSLGAGPRHLALHPSGNLAYVAEELTSTVGVLAINKTNGTLTIIQDTVQSLPKGYKEPNTSADIHTDPKGKFLYLSNRGHDALAVYTIAEDGKITLSGQTKTMGKTPRNFLVDRKGKFIWVANQNSDNITIFKINPKTGLPVYTGQQVKVPSPVCIKQLILK